MNNLVAGLIGVGMFAGFVGFLAIRVGEWPLAIIILAAIAMAATDLVQDLRDGS